MANSVPNTLVAEAAAGLASAWVAIRQLTSLRNSVLACTRARVSWTHSASMTRWPLASLVARAHVAHLAQRGPDRGRGGEGHPLVVELVGDQRPALVLLADQGGGGHPDVGVVGRAGGRPGHGGHRRPGEPGGAGRHDEDGQAPVPGGLRVGAAGQPDVVGVLDQAGPHLLAVDDVVRRRRGRRGCAAPPGRCRPPARSSRSRSGSRRRRSGAGRTPSARRCRSA